MPFWQLLDNVVDALYIGKPLQRIVGQYIGTVVYFETTAKSWWPIY